MGLFVKLANGSHHLTTFTKSSILDVWVGSECAFEVISDEHQYQLGWAYYKTRNTGTRNYPTRNTGGTPKNWHNNGALAEQSEYHGIEEHEKSSRITEQQDNTKKYYQYRTTTYWADNITKFKTIKFFQQGGFWWKS